MPPDVRAIGALLLTLLAPGWALLIVTGTWRSLPPLRRWALAVAVSVTFLAALFYFARVVDLTIRPWGLAALLIAALAIIARHTRRQYAGHLAFDRLEWLAILIVLITIGTRVALAITHPYPAWADSLHHSLITKLTIERGQLPVTLEPYVPIELGQYHLGFYGVSATLAMLGGLPAHTAVLWAGQAMSALAGLGAYFVLDRWAGRWGAVVALAAIGLGWTEAATFINLGRVTQLTSNFLLLFAWSYVLEALTCETRDRTRTVVIAGVLCAGVF